MDGCAGSESLRAMVVICVICGICGWMSGGVDGWVEEWEEGAEWQECEEWEEGARAGRATGTRDCRPIAQQDCP